MNKIQLTIEFLIVFAISFVMFILVLLTSNKIYALNYQVPFELIGGIVMVGIIGIPLYLLNKNPYKYIIFSPLIFLALLFILRTDPHA
ncbi:MAG: hypothetical protein J4F36_11285 [Nitrosopumilaceae archaeon]|nr:hypothetical protein [Nitrosopumilaceae archaeon]